MASPDEAADALAKKNNNRIQVANTNKRPLYFYVNLTKKFMEKHEEVELSALGMAITTVVTVVEILKNDGWVVEKKITTSTVNMTDKSEKTVPKAKIEIVLGRSAKYPELAKLSAAQNESESQPVESQTQQAV